MRKKTKTNVMMIHKNESQYSRLIIAIVGPTKNSVKFAQTQSKNLKKKELVPITRLKKCSSNKMSSKNPSKFGTFCNEWVDT